MNRIERAARKEAETFWALRDEAQKELAESLVRFALRERKRALREAERLFPCHRGCSCELDEVRLVKSPESVEFNPDGSATFHLPDLKPGESVEIPMTMTFKDSK
jgi:hypothetical protein